MAFLSFFLVFLSLFFLFSQNAFAMHINEGFMPLSWCLFWAILCVPFVILGTASIKKYALENQKNIILLSMCAAFAFILSSLELPSVAGSSSHPAGIGLGAILFGYSAMSVLGVIILLFQALILAEGGLTTLGANLFAMFIVGSFAAFFSFKYFRKRLGDLPAFALAIFLSNISIYFITSFQLAAALTNDGAVSTSFLKFLSIFAITQVPIAVLEAILSVGVYKLLLKYIPLEMKNLMLKYN